MGDDAYADYVEARYHGEVFGEAFFGAMAVARTDPEEARKMRALARLERETKERLAPEVEATGRKAVSGSEAVEQARALGAQLGQVPWLDLVGSMRSELEEFVAEFREAESLAPPGREALLRHVTAHEQALLDFVDAELAGRGETSLVATAALLEEG